MERHTSRKLPEEESTAICAAFRNFLQDDTRNTLSTFATTISADQLAGAFERMLRDELNWRTKRGEPLPLSYYIGAFPQFDVTIRRLFEEPRELSTVPGLSFKIDTSLVNDLGGKRTAQFGFGQIGDGPGQEFPPSDRFENRGKLGAGGMGVVFRAWDKNRNGEVALKCLPFADGEYIFRFKQEFRSLTDLDHPNIIRLYELHFEHGRWFFTMELIEGTDLLSYINQLHHGREYETLRILFSQVSDGLAFLHHAGQVHSDVKPANILVDEHGRVVITDMGLVTRSKTLAWEHSIRAGAYGTIPYMAPEIVDQPPTTASDCYAMGVMIYQILAGRYPFTETGLQGLIQKRNEDPPPIEEVKNTALDPLIDLSLELLSRDPSARPTAADIAARLGAHVGSQFEERKAPDSPPSGRRIPFVGRTAELGILSAALSKLRVSAEPQVIHLRGESGLGKTAIVDHFLRTKYGNESDFVFLTGKCNERESVPFKAIDGIVDSISRYLTSLEEKQIVALLPRHAAELACLFPVLHRVEAWRLHAAPVRSTDPQKIRINAIGALREFLSRLSDRKALLLFIDDVQWGDADSADVIRRLITVPDAPQMLMVLAYRPADIPHSECLSSLLEKTDDADDLVEPTILNLEKLSLEESRQLAGALLDDAAGERAKRIADAARDADGNPYYLSELAQLGDSNGKGASLTVDDVIWDRTQNLESGPKSVLQTLAIVGRPIEEQLLVAMHAGSATTDDAIHRLIASRLVRFRGSSTTRLVECYHDRVRESVCERLEPELVRQVHARVYAHIKERAQQHLDSIDGEAKHLATHSEGAGEFSEAAIWYQLAGKDSVKKLAFGQASQQFQRSLDCLDRIQQPDDQNEATRLRSQASLAQSLAFGGKGGEAAEKYLESARLSTEVEALELRRKAAEQLLISGRLREGQEELENVLRQSCIRIPRTLNATLLGIAWHQVHIWVRLRNLRKISPLPVDSPVRSRITVCWTATMGLSVIDPLKATYYQSVGMLNTLRSGDPFLLARGLMWHAVLEATKGTRSKPVVEKTMKLGNEYAKIDESPYLSAFETLARGTIAFLFGDWKKSQESAVKAQKMFQEGCAGANWELDTSRSLEIWASYHLTDLVSLRQRLPNLVSEARYKGNLYALHNYACFALPLVQLASDKPDKAREAISEVSSFWNHDAYTVQYFNQATEKLMVNFYEEKFTDARETAIELAGMIAKSGYHRILFFRVFHAFFLAEARAKSEGSAAIASLQRSIKLMQRESICYAKAYAEHLRARIADIRCDQATCQDHLRRTVDLYLAADMPLRAESARRRLGELLGGTEGAQLIDKSETAMRSQTVENPARMASMFFPRLQQY